MSRDGEIVREVECLGTIGSIAGRVAHEINNPLAGIHNAFRLVKDGIPASHPHYAYVAAIERQIQRIAAVTRRLADTYNPESDRAVGVATSAIVSDAAQLALLATGTAAARLELLNAVQVPFPVAAGVLRHILIQIFEAAIRSSDPDTRLMVMTTLADDILKVQVRYHAARSSHPLEPERHTERLLAAIDGAIELIDEDDRMTSIEVRIPLTRTGEGTR